MLEGSAVTVGVRVGVSGGKTVEVCVLVGNPVSVGRAVTVGAGTGNAAGVHASMMSMRIPRTSAGYLIISIYPFSLQRTHNGRICNLICKQ